jgi:hypothetical protein
VYVTHDQIEAMTMADKIVVMHDGAWSRWGAAGALRQAREPVRGNLHRLAGHEPDRGADYGRRLRDGGRAHPAAGLGPGGLRRAAGSVWHPARALQLGRGEGCRSRGRGGGAHRL